MINTYIKRIFPYLLTLFAITLLLQGCGGRRQDDSWKSPKAADVSDMLIPAGEIPLKAAGEFVIDSYEGGYYLIRVSDGRRYLVIPEDGDTPQDLPDDVICLKKPLDRAYLAATAAMDMICALDAGSNVRFSSLRAGDWSIDEAAERMRSGDMLYGGKYSMPDYELLTKEHCSIALENTMILHSPDVIEQLGAFDIPVFIDRATYEEEPLGRIEWIKVYGVLFDRQDAAGEIFGEQESCFEEPLDTEDGERPRVAFFYIGENGIVSVRNGNDYLAKMLEMSGGDYVFSDLTDEDSHRVSVNLQMEAFYEKAVDADVLIYNDFTGQGMSSLSDLTDKADVLKDFRAVQNKKVWCVQRDLYQNPLSMGEVMMDFKKIFTGDTDLEYLYPLE